ncbi:HlyD family secretion protein [Ammonifex thiophilus]|uniref:HlyD family secretion protein n=1 Tax=Ammonifex thiophilus TaxID=444093 RepID=A0A3D8P7I6_9THEO|nr:HlyD family efflux transporter periplasmic adaptor subunit [Ammonifex thiophilus]RDV84495.1 HlyD family secretion protein [Ammonifex thiophilus]
MPKPKAAFVAVLLFFLLTIGGIGFYYWYQNAHYVTTEDAYVDGPMWRLGPSVAGKIASIPVKEGDQVEPGQEILRLDNRSLPPGADPDLAIVRSPVKGIVLKVSARPGEVVGAGQPVVLVGDPRQFYITANVDESKIWRVHPGQRVVVRIDALPGRVFEGRIAEINTAVASTFSLIPTRSTSGSFVKVSQRVPVKIYLLDAKGADLRLGESAEVKIFARE